MNKKLLAVAIAAATAAPAAAMADVTVYGMVQVEVASEEVDTSLGKGDNFMRAGRQQDGTTVEDNQRGRFGIKASEKLGNGMTGMAKIEYDLGDTPEFQSTPNLREGWVGLKGNFGTFSAGTVKSPYKYTGGVKYDPFVTTNLEARRNGGMIGGIYGANGFLSNSVSYESPDMGGFSVWAVYSPDEFGSSSGDEGDWALSLKYANGPFEVFLAGANDQANAGGDDNQNWKIGGKATFGNHTIVAQFEDAENVDQIADRDGQLLFLGYNLKMGANTLVAQIGLGEEEFGGGDDQEHTYFTLGAIHKMSKTFRIFGGYTQTSVDNVAGGTNDGDRSAFSVGMRKDF